MQNLAYSLWTHPGTGPLPIGRIRKLAILAGRIRGFSWSLLMDCRFSKVGVVVGVAAADAADADALGLKGPRWFLSEHRKCASHSFFTLAAFLNFDPLLNRFIVDFADGKANIHW
jgi:hypothetical protein